jgi:hypothetical protein
MRLGLGDHQAARHLHLEIAAKFILE